MPINVSEAIDPDTSVLLTVKRKTGGAYVDGRYFEGTESTFKSMISPQQPSGKELERLPEGERDKDIMKFISAKELRGTSDRDGIEGDIVTFKGIDYKIINDQDWILFGQGTYLGARVQEEIS